MKRYKVSVLVTFSGDVQMDFEMDAEGESDVRLNLDDEVFSNGAVDFVEVDCSRVSITEIKPPSPPTMEDTMRKRGEPDLFKDFVGMMGYGEKDG